LKPAANSSLNNDKGTKQNKSAPPLDEPVRSQTKKIGTVVAIVMVLLLLLIAIAFLCHRSRANQQQKRQAAEARAELDGNGIMEMVDNPHAVRANVVAAAAAPDDGVHETAVDLLNVGYAAPGYNAPPISPHGGAGNGVYYDADPTPDDQVAQYEDMSMGGQQLPHGEGAGAVPVARADAAHGVAAGTVIYDGSGGDAQYVAREDMAGGDGNVNYEVLDADGGGGAPAAAPRPGVVGEGAVVVGGRAQLPSTATSNDVYDEASLYASNNGTIKDISNNTVIYDMGPESEQQAQRQRGSGGGGGSGGSAVVHAPPAYAVPVKRPKSRPDENNTYDMQVPGKKSKGAAATSSAQAAKEAAAASSTGTRPDENNVYDMQVPGKKNKGAAAATAARVAKEATSGGGGEEKGEGAVGTPHSYVNVIDVPPPDAGGAAAASTRPLTKLEKMNALVAAEPSIGEGGGGSELRHSSAAKKCTRPAPTGGTCTNAVLPGGGQFCKSHACPECGAGKSSSVAGCPMHLAARTKKKQQRKSSADNGVDAAGDDAEA
jgi:hypothetical protein